MPFKDRDPERDRAYQRDFDRIRREALNRLKVRLGCADCGYNEHPAALDFDHRPGTDKCFGIGAGNRRALADLLEEISKCDVVCANCHRIRTWKRKRGVL